MAMIDQIQALYQELLTKYKNGISNTSTAKFNPIKDLFGEKYGLAESDVYATAAGNRPGNLEVRLSQGIQATKHTSLCLAFLIDKEGSVDNRLKLVKSTFVTIRKSLGRGKASYDNILIFVESQNHIYPSGLMYTPESSIAKQLQEDFNIELVKLASDEKDINLEKKTDEGIMFFSKKDLFKDDFDNLILFGPPGTGKTYRLQEYVAALGDDSYNFNVTFHQSFSYEDFIEGLKPELENKDLSYYVAKGVFLQACEKACQLAGYPNMQACINDNNASRKENFDKAKDEGRTVLLTIDELNRGNVASIFGELISLIEESKRLGTSNELITTLPYSKALFGVPANLRIVCTMNTADRCIQLLDSAIRRRFRFEELLPDYTLVKNKDAKTILQGINARIRCLLNKDSQIGHSYLMHCSTNKEILDAHTNKIIPLLEEYFYNDITQVRFVLNETKDNAYNFYKEDKDARKAFELYQNFADIDAEDKTFYGLDEDIKSVEDEDECAKYLQHLLPSEE